MNIDEMAGEDLRLEANRTRSKFLRTIDEIHRRGDEVVDLGIQLRRHVRFAVLSTAVAGMVSTTLTWLLLRSVSAWRRRRLPPWARIWTAGR